MGKVIVTQTGSQIRAPKKQKLTLRALGLRRINQSVEHEATPQIQGMISKVAHLVSVEEKN
jgi:large subunit ribosomal protein L30